MISVIDLAGINKYFLKKLYIILRYIQKRNRTRYELIDQPIPYKKNSLDEEKRENEDSPAIVSVHNTRGRREEIKFQRIYRGTFGLKSCQAERASRKNQGFQAFQTSNESRPTSSSPLIPTHDREVRILPRPRIQSSSVE